MSRIYNLRPAVTVKTLSSIRGRNIIRRNYRWLRRRGIGPDTARIILDSTMFAMEMDARYATFEAAPQVTTIVDDITHAFAGAAFGFNAQ